MSNKNFLTILNSIFEMKCRPHTICSLHHLYKLILTHVLENRINFASYFRTSLSCRASRTFEFRRIRSKREALDCFDNHFAQRFKFRSVNVVGKGQMLNFPFRSVHNLAEMHVHIFVFLRRCRQTYRRLCVGNRQPSSMRRPTNC